MLLLKFRFFLMCLVYGRRLGFVKEVRIGANSLYKIWVNGETFWVARKERIFRYIYGISARLQRVCNSYGFGDVILSKDVSVIDIGCNDGSFLANFQKSRSSVIGIDLELNELFCAAANVPNSEVIRAGIWFESGIGSFESAPKSSDSSLIRSGKSNDILSVPLLTIDEILPIILNPSKTLDILKIEAEGAEPEVLAGATKSLQRVRYVAVDVGPERGPMQDRTCNSVIQILTSINFQNIWTSEKKNRMLFKNKSLISDL